MDYDSLTSLGALFYDQADRLGDRPFLWAKRDGAWRATAFAEAAAEAAALGSGLEALGVAPGDRVVLCSENRPEWMIAYAAILSAGGIVVPAYTTNQAADHAHVLRDSGARGAICSTAAFSERMLQAMGEAPEARFLVGIDPPPAAPGVETASWSALAADGAGAVDAARAAVARHRRGDTACLIYTSGTGGAPKGVVLSHGAILANCKGAYRVLEELGLEDEVFLSFLPLSHSYEHTAGLMFPLSIGAQIYYAEGAERLAANLVEVRPTIMTAVPRLYETMHARMVRGIRHESGLKRRLFLKAVELGRRRYHDPRSLNPAERLLDALLERLVRAKVRARFGGRLKALVSGGAPLNADIGLFFTALGLRLLQGYGQTEAAPVVSCNPPSRVRIETVGPPVDGVDVRIAADGEILVRGELVMDGYWGDPERTAEALRDGWLHTGDIGEIDPDGYIRITDRKKDIIVLSGGDNVSPQRIEGLLTLEPEIGQAMVYGDRRPHLVALIVPDSDFVQSLAASLGRAPEAGVPIEDPTLHDAVAAAVERVNARLGPIERIRHFRLRAEPFSTENGMMTPSLKIRRHKILETHGAELEGLY